MLILAVDTSGRNGSVALCRGDAGNFEVVQFSELEGGTYSARLVPTIADLLRRAGHSKAQLDLLVVVDGPGSFTGLRVGLSTIKALCEVLQKPLVVVSMLEALAVHYGNEGENVTTLLDAGRGELYIGEYRVSRQGAQRVRESIAKVDEFVPQIASRKSRLVTPVAKVAEVIAAAPSEVALVNALHAGDLGRIGLRKFLAGEVADPTTLDANYIRRSDAELFSLPKP